MTKKSDDDVTVDATWLVCFTIGLLVLKYTLAPQLSWWVVTSPLWILPAIFLAIAGTILIVAAICFLVGYFIIAVYDWHSHRKFVKSVVLAAKNRESLTARFMK